ncbi:matrix metalloproteinase-24-like [Camponotus floridanus]|uniref:matrix metalloproteinase-24-like n=1 Tax=Camponotus floridanus TaxID=104421 RepID=UPI000DC66560|nr:matrix metalloproteinase-24-like [Camponotus floridanus]
MTRVALSLALTISLLAAVAATSTHDDVAEASRYLRTYGFLENEENHQQSSLLDNATALSEALSLFQEYYGLPGNGILTVETIRVMRRPRCGVADIRAYSPLTRKWPRAHVTWNFKLANRDTLRTTQSAFSLWSEQSALTFSRDSLRPDILISYQSGAHAYENSDNGGSCPSPFARPGSVVAHAFFPTGEPDQVTEVHVDETEPWHITLTKPSSDRLYLLQTLTHEIGHTLGLTHSTRDDSVMYAYTPSEERRYPLRLSVEDVVNVRNLYGSRETTTPRIVDVTRPTTAATIATTTTASRTTTAAAAQPTTARTVEPPLVPSDTTDLCALKRVDGALIMNRRLYVARKRNVWPVDMRERRYGAPFSFADYFKFLLRNLTRVSAVYQRPSGDIAIFVGDYVYLADSNFHLKAGWPRSVEYVGFPRDARINAAINTHAGRSYVIYNDDKIAEMNDCAMTVARHGALRDTFSGIPPAITAAFRHIDGNLYFLKKRDYYAYSEFLDAIISAGPFDLSILGIECPADGILHRLSELVSKLYRLEYASFERPRNGDDDDDD